MVKKPSRTPLSVTCTIMDSKGSLAVWIMIISLPPVISFSTFEGFKSDGAVSDVCSLKINHNDTSTNPAHTSPVQLSTSDVFYIPSSNVTINVVLTLRNKQDGEGIDRLKGFVLMARRVNDSSGESVGSWIPKNGQQIVSCGSSMVVMHKTKSWKSLPIKFTFVPPTSNIGTIEFRLSAVYNFTVYWENLEFDIHLNPPEVCKWIDCSNQENEAACSEYAFEGTIFEFSTNINSSVISDGNYYYQGITRHYNTCTNLQVELWLDYIIPTSYTTLLEISAGDGDDVLLNPLVDLSVSNCGNGQSVRVLSSGPYLWLKVSVRYLFQDKPSDVAHIVGRVQSANSSFKDLDCGDNFNCQNGVCIPPSFVCDGQVDCSNGADETSSSCTYAVENEMDFNIEHQWEDNFLIKASRFFQTIGYSRLEILLNIFISYGETDLSVSVGDGNDTSRNQLVDVYNYEYTYNKSFRILSNGSSLWLFIDINPFFPEEFVKVKINGHVKATNVTLHDWSCGSDFACMNGVCIPQSSVCDGSNDCLNGVDELLSSCPVWSCNNEFDCGNGVCLPISFVCDGSRECSNGADEDMLSCTDFVADEIAFNISSVSSLPSYDYICLRRVYNTSDDSRLELLLNFDIPHTNVEFFSVSIGQGNSFFFRNLVKFSRYYIGTDTQTLKVLSSGSELWAQIYIHSYFHYNDEPSDDLVISGTIRAVNVTASDWNCENSFGCTTNRVCLPLSFVCDGQNDCDDRSDEDPLSCTDQVDDEVTFSISAEKRYYTFDGNTDYRFFSVIRFFETDLNSQLELMMNFTIRYGDADAFLLSIGEGSTLNQNRLLTLTRYHFSDDHQVIKILSTGSFLGLKLSLTYLPNVDDFTGTIVSVKVKKVRSSLDVWRCGDEFDCGDGVCLPQAFVCDRQRDCGSDLDEDISLCTEYVHDLHYITLFPGNNSYISNGIYGIQLVRYYQACADCQIEMSLNFNTDSHIESFSVFIGEGSNLFSKTLVRLSDYYIGNIPQNLRVTSTDSTVWLSLSISHQPHEDKNGYAIITGEIREIRAMLQDWHCDGGLDCMNGVCLPHSLACDGQTHCSNRLDETNLFCTELIACDMNVTRTPYKPNLLVREPNILLCECAIGFEGNEVGCEDIDECSVNLHNCSSQVTCSNTVGSYTCKCLEGFYGDGYQCSDINECFEDIHNCSSQAHCENTIGNYTCQCFEGFEGNGYECTDVDECSEYIHNCSRQANCTNTMGNYSCQCFEGFEGNGYECTDIDECIQDIYNCSAEARCSNTMGSYTCQCVNGYEGDGFQCKDVDECSEKIHNCSKEANCENTVGNYTCQCFHGFQGNGYQCTDVDECSEDIDSCDNQASCSNTIGSYACQCKDGFDGDGFQCMGLCPAENVTLSGVELSFPSATSGQVVRSLQKCPSNSGNPMALSTRFCEDAWNEPTLQECNFTDTMLTEMLQDILKTNISESNVETVAADLVVLTVQKEDISTDDLDIVIESLGAIVEVNSASTQVTDAVVGVVNNIMELDNETIDETEDVGSIPFLLEQQVASTLSSGHVGENYTEVLDNIGISTIALDKGSLQESITFGTFQDESKESDRRAPLDEQSTGFIDNANEASKDIVSSISIPADILDDLPSRNITTIVVSFIIFRQPTLFSVDNTSTIDGSLRSEISSQVIAASISVDGATISNLPPNSTVTIALHSSEELSENEIIVKRECVYWKYLQSTGKGSWSTEGCELPSYSAESSVVMCSCDHLTSFAVLVHVAGKYEDDQFFAVISIIGCALSICGLLVCLLLILLVKSVRKKQQSHVHLNLCLALICFYLTFLIGIDRTSNPIVCRIIASAIHYFCLSSVAWTSVEAFTLYKYIWEMRRNDVNYLIRIALIFGWGLPVIPVALVFFLSDSHIYYDESQYCFIPPNLGLYFGFLLEVVLFVLFNCISFVLVTYRVTCRKIIAKNEAAKKREMVTRIKSVFFFWILLGLSWLFGFLAAIDSVVKVVFQVLFSALLALQGFGMFYILVAQNNDMKKSLKGFSSNMRASVSLPNSSKYSLSGYREESSVFTSSVSRSLSRSDNFSMSGVQKDKYTPRTDL